MENDLIIQEQKELEGVEPSKAAAIKKTFAPLVKMLESFEEAFNEIMAEEVTEELCGRAKRLRLDISKIRVSADKARKAQKEEYLRAGNAIQGVFNILKFAVTDKEEKLKDIEQHFEKIEADRITKLQADRQLELAKYDVDGEFVELGKMNLAIWDNYLNGIRATYEAVKEAEQKAEADRLEAEEAERVEQARIRTENEKLKKEAEAREAEAAAERERFRLAKEESDKELARIQAENDEKLKKEAEAREAIEKREADRIQAEKKETDRLKAEKAKDAAAPDLNRLTDIYKYLREQYAFTHSTEAKNGISEAGKIITATIEALEI